MRGERHQQVVTIGRAARDDFTRHNAAAARTIVHDHLLAPLLAQLLRDGARKAVCTATDRAAHDITHGANRIVTGGRGLRLRLACGYYQNQRYV